MDKDLHSNSDEIQRQRKAGKPSEKRGHLKVFLGYAPGVGKTYAMLEAARQRRAQGADVVVGCVETHQDIGTDKLLEDLETLPLQEVSELDLDAVLVRRPQLVLVDNLAHANAPGSRHARRYQDVEELLESGMDVYSTLNVQNIESLKDVVEQITGIRVRETIPDRVIDEAAELELIDLSPEELLGRFHEGKVFVPNSIQRNAQNFYRQGNLTALRELAMRRVARRVDDQMRAYMRSQSIPGPWPAEERLLVCISPGSLGERLIRAARRLADELKAEWHAIYVETPDQAKLSQEQRDRVASALRLAEELGARTITRPGQSVPETVMDYARRHNITKIIAGKPRRTRWMELLHGSVVDRLIARSGSIDIYVISSEAENSARRVAEGWRPHRPLLRYVWGLALLAAATALSALIAPHISPTNLVMIYLLSVVIAAVYLGRGPAVMVSVMGVVIFDYFFVPPHLTFAIANTEYLLTFLGLLAVGLVVSQLTATVHEQAEAAQNRETQTVALYELGRDLTVAGDLKSVTQTVIEHISQVFGREVAVFLTEGKILKSYATSPGLTISDSDLAVANWSFIHGQAAGRGTDTLPEASMRYQPLKTTRGVIGVLGVKPASFHRLLTRDQLRTLDAFANQIALAIERTRLDEQARQAEVLEITDNLQNALLSSISHDLRTPLVSITGALSSLADDQVALDDTARRSLVETAGEEADRLNRLVGNLLDMTRLESGAMRINRAEADIQDLIGSSLEELRDRLANRRMTVNVPSDLPLVPLDFVLIQRVLVNVIDNALKYSPPETPIEIQAHMAGAFVEITVADRGVGIPPEDMGRIFDKFYRVQRPDNINGTGLGLAICKGIVEAHGGFISAENRSEGGTMITIALPTEVPS